MCVYEFYHVSLQRIVTRSFLRMRRHVFRNRCSNRANLLLCQGKLHKSVVSHNLRMCVCVYMCVYVCLHACMPKCDSPMYVQACARACTRTYALEHMMCYLHDIITTTYIHTYIQYNTYAHTYALEHVRYQHGIQQPCSQYTNAQCICQGNVQACVRKYVNDAYTHGLDT
jgi:hypothetical protein